jgi:hypothetical protein
LFGFFSKRKFDTHDETLFAACNWRANMDAWRQRTGWKPESEQGPALEIVAFATITADLIFQNALCTTKRTWEASLSEQTALCLLARELAIVAFHGAFDKKDEKNALETIMTNLVQSLTRAPMDSDELVMKLSYITACSDLVKKTRLAVLHEIVRHGRAYFETGSEAALALLGALLREFIGVVSAEARSR